MKFMKIDGISETVQENSEKIYGRKSAGKGRNSTGNGRNHPELHSQQKDVSEVDGKKYEWKEFPTESVLTNMCVY